ncbi:MAG: response regulator [Candidatus Methanomethylophilus sp.]|nr:response regulator [Methanomethylophilus sp.]
MRILAVDDEKDALEVLVAAISECEKDAEIKAFNSPTEALNYAAENPPDIAFLDIRMPTMSGLDLAKKLKAINVRVNIVFSTGYSEYASDAFSMHASGYIMKPVSVRLVRKELENLRNPVETPNNRIFVRTFGNFELFVDGETLHFSRKPAKELLAYLVDRKGSAVTRKELCSVLLQDEAFTRKSQDYLTKIVKELQKTLDEVNAGSIVNLDRSEYSVIPDNFSCDAYDYLKGVPNAFNNFYGEYMSQYPWAEKSIQQFYK